MSAYEDILAATVRQAVAEAVEPLRREIAALRTDKDGAVTIAEAARRLNLSPRTISRHIARGEIQTILVGRSRRVVLASLQPTSRG